MKNDKRIFGSILKDSLLILLVSILILGTIFSITVKNIILNDNINKSKIVSSSFSNYIEETITHRNLSLLNIINELKHFENKSNFNKEDLIDDISEIVKNDSFYLYFEILDENGKVIITTRNNSISLGNDRSNLSAFVDAKKTSKVVWSSIFTSQIDGMTTMTTSIKQDNFTIVGYLDFNKISKLISEYEKSNYGDFNLYITDSNGYYIYNKNDSLVEQRQLDPYFSSISKLYQREKTTSNFKMYDMNALVSVNKINGPNWYVVIFINSRSYAGAIETISFAAISILAISIAMILLFILRRTKNITNSIEKINKRTEEIALGNYGGELETQNYKELNELVNRFNDMTDCICERDRKLYDSAIKDNLTNVLNRQGLINVLDTFVDNKILSQFAFIYFDIDNFKNINDTFGHISGDNILKNIISIFNSYKSDDDFISRLGGDEFIIIHQHTDNNELKKYVKGFMKCISENTAEKDVSIGVTLSFGVSIYPNHGNDFGYLMQAADLALYNSKKTGKNRYTFFDKKMMEKLHKDYAIEMALKTAIENEELYLAFQPQITENGEIRGFEALIRWYNEKLGYLLPNDFLRIAEETNDIIAIGRWAFEKACITIKEINQRFNKDFCVSVNFSAIEIATSDFCCFVTQTVSKHEIKPEWIEIEITEKNAITINEHTKQCLENIRNFGISIALDDFGTGFSGLSYLVDFPITTIKLDQFFISDIDSCEKKRNLVKSVVAMSEIFKFNIIAEFVERELQAKLLKDLSCNIYQGYYFCKPLKADDLFDYIKDKYNIN